MPKLFKGKPKAPVVEAKETWDEHVVSVLEQLESLYNDQVLPVETRYDYNVFRPSWFADSIKQKKPFVTVLGSFSSGKSSLLNYLLQSEHLLTGPQPVTDKFTAVMYGEEVMPIPGRVLMSDSRLPFRGLTEFGDSFGEFFSGLTVPHPILKSVTFVDTPGILETTGNVHSRRYDYAKVVRWFVARSDLVLFLFDPTKLDSGNELRRVFTESIHGEEGKIRIVLNKADSVQPQELLRVYGSLFWNLSSLLRTTEPPRLYLCSFRTTPYVEGTDQNLFEREKEDLLYELIETVPAQSLDRRVTAMMRRVTDVLLFALICATYRTKLPAVFGKNKAKNKFFDTYEELAKDLATRYRVSERDFPAVEDVRSFLLRVDSHNFPDMDSLKKKKWVEQLKQLVDVDLPKLLVPLKEHAVVDPKDKKAAILLQRNYVTDSGDSS